MNYNFHKNYIVEQALTISDDPKERIRQYCENNDFLKNVLETAQKLKDGEQYQFQIRNDKFDVKEGDKIFIKADLSDKNDPKFSLWILNDEFLFGDTDYDVAAALLYQASKIVGTTEEDFAGVVGAITRIANEKGIESDVLFDKLNDTLIKNYGANWSLNKIMDEEFSGADEAVGLNAFRRQIPKDTWRGIEASLTTIIADLTLTAVTFGAGSAASALFKTGKIGGRSLELAHKGTEAAKAASTANKLKFMKSFKSLWNGLSPAKKAASLEKAYPVGSKIGYHAARSGERSEQIIKSINKTSVTFESGFTTSLDNLVMLAGKPGGITFNSLSKLKIAGGFAAKKGADILNNMNIPVSQADGFNLAEVLGYYDTLAADPKNYVNSIKEKDAKAIANNLLELKNGSGLFRNTTDQEELAIGLLITSLTPEMCKKVAKYYSKIDPGNTVYNVITDELGGDLKIFTSAYWSGCTGEAGEYTDKINQVYSSIMEKKEEKK
jgi:hypothetical protein